MQTAVFEGHMAKVMTYNMLTKDVLELSLQVDTPLSISPGQYILFCLKDFDGEFTRSYSVVEKSENSITL
ncbi:MAG: hypothetical protein WCJ39_04290 [bacterium]